MNEAKKILEDTESKPQLTDKNWVKHNKYLSFKPTTKTEYTINQQLINQLTKFNELFETINKKEQPKVYANDATDKLIKRVFIATDTTKPENIFICHASSSMLKYIKISLHKYLLNNNDKDQVFFKLKTTPGTTKFKLLEYVKLDDDNDKITINVIKDGYKNLKRGEEQQQVQPQIQLPLADLFNALTKHCTDVIKKSIPKKAPKTKYYIYELFNHKNNKKYIDYTDIETIEKNKGKILTSAKRNFKGEDKVKVQDIKLKTYETLEVFIPTEINLKTDYYIIINNSIANGYNKSCNFIECDLYNDSSKLESLKKHIFIKVQADIVDIKHKNNIKKEGIIYHIVDKKKKKYIGYSNEKKSLKDMIKHLYSDALADIDRPSKISNLLGTVPFKNLKAGEYKKIKDRTFEQTAEHYRKKTDSYDNGYNVDTAMYNKGYLKKIQNTK